MVCPPPQGGESTGPRRQAISELSSPLVDHGPGTQDPRIPALAVLSLLPLSVVASSSGPFSRGWTTSWRVHAYTCEWPGAAKGGELWAELAGCGVHTRLPRPFLKNKRAGRDRRETLAGRTGMGGRRHPCVLLPRPFRGVLKADHSSHLCKFHPDKPNLTVFCDP